MKYLLVCLLVGIVAFNVVLTKPYDDSENENQQDEASGSEGLEKRSMQRMNNIGYLMKGYNLIQGNPMDPDQLDPGFASKIFETTYEQNKKTSDQRWNIPDNIEIVAKPTCSSSYSSETLSTQSDYQKSLQAKVAVSGSASYGLVEASFSASTEYTKTSSVLKSNTKTIIKTEATCAVYEGKNQNGIPPKFTDNFVESVKQTLKSKDYSMFLDDFGTHFISKVTMGARYAKLQELSKEKQEKMQEEGIDVQLTASVSAEGTGSLSVDASVKVSDKQTEKFEKAVENVKIVSIGSSPPKDGNTETWVADTIADSTRILPISYSLRSIVHLFKPQYFERHPDIDYRTFKREITETLLNYCKAMKRIHKNAECEGPPTGCAGGSTCSVNARCNDNGENSPFTCTCKSGFKGNGKICLRVPRWLPTTIIQQTATRGYYGTWGGMEHCRNGYFASEFQLKAEPWESNNDDTGANAVSIKCSDNNNVCSKMGPWGVWGKVHKCPKGSFLSGWRQNVEASLGGDGDDTSLANVQYKCRDGETWEVTSGDNDMMGQGANYGRWSRFKECPRGEFICGIQTRVEDPISGDDTALNDIKHQCCQPVVKKKKKSN